MPTTLDAQIDALYAAPLAAFVSARGALAKSLGGEVARQVRALAKPTTVPWAVNQVRWHHPHVYERLLKTGAALRAAQVAALEGRGAGAAEASAAHRRAVAEATQAAVDRAAAGGRGVEADTLSRMLETVSLAEHLPEPHGRFTMAVQPAGFEALLGIAVKAVAPDARKDLPCAASEKPGASSRVDAATFEQALRLASERAAAAELRRLATLQAEAAVALARTEEERTRQAWRRAKDDLIAAEQTLEDARRSLQQPEADRPGH